MLSLPPSFFDHLADRLELAVYDTNQEWRDAMKIRITEPVFFEGKNRQVGEEMDVERGPYRKVLTPNVYGYELEPQFVELPIEIKASPVTDMLTPGTLGQNAQGANAQAAANQTLGNSASPSPCSSRARTVR
jgi:hypothetical protein